MANIFLERYRQLGHNLTGFEQTRQAIRVNTLKISKNDLLKRLEAKNMVLSEIEWLKESFFVDEGYFSIGASFEYLLGLYSIQEAASQFPAQILEPLPGEIVLDMCAAPGGKTTQIAALMENKGVIIAVDINRDRLYALENHLERCGIENCIVYWGDARKMDYQSTLFDSILIDAPCSGNFVNDGSWFKKRDLGDVNKNSAMQRELMTAALELLKSGGTLVYATCSLEPEENELNIQWLLQKNSIDLERIEGPGSPAMTEVFGEKLHPKIANCRRFWPDETGTQGFFVAKVVKK
jgi:NOL1/NOP2/sun family putative RNA methylase